jgi:pyruvate dehydrogenase E2 component (dihydrolipoamide acetyltransferase)
LKANAFGNVVLTNIGSLGLEEGFAPIPSPLHCCICACLGSVVKKPVVVDGDKIEIREMMKCVYTLDHRQGDAASILQFLKIMKDLIENPEGFNPEKYPELPSYEEIAKRRAAAKKEQ